MVATPERRVLHAPLRVLLVEDSEDDALLLLRELRRAGYEPDHVRVETPAAMERALAERWDVIFSDHRMPRFSAMEALQMASTSGSDAPFIVVSGRIGEDVAVEAMRCGAYDYVMKGNLARLPQTVERGLEKAEERRQRRRIEEELERRDAILDAVRFAADQFLGEAVSWEESIRTVLRRLGEATQASRVYVFESYTGEDGELWGTMQYEWAVEGVSSQMKNPTVQAIAYKAAGYGRWIETLGRGELVYGHTREFPEGERWALLEQGILSIVVVPIFVEGRLWGHIGFDECVEEREWSGAEIGALGAAAGTLGAAIRRRRTEEQLRGSEERYRAVIEQATDGIYLLDAETRRLIETNPSFQRMLGYTVEEIEGLCVYDLVAHPREDVDSTIARTLQSGRRIVGERKYRRKDGSLLDVEVGVSVISLDGRDVVCTIVRDVSGRKEAERRLQEAEVRYRTLVERIPATIYIQTPKTAEEDSYAVAYMSPQVEKILGHSPRRFEGDPGFWNELVHPEDLKRMMAETERTDETGEPFGMEYRMLHKDGGYRWIRDEAVLVSDERGNPSYWQGVFSDVTERKRAEELLGRSESRLRQIIETEPECVKVLGANGSLVEMNPAGLSMIEADSLEQVRGKTVYDYISPGHRDAFVELTEKVLRGGSGSLEFELVGLKGTRRWLDTNAVPLREAAGGGSGLLAITRDITERKLAEQALKQSERLYRAVIEQATENIFLIDVETRRIVESNPAFREALGYSEEELQRMTLYDIVAADRESVDLNMRRTLEEGRALVGERRYRRKDGTLLDVEVGGSIILRDGRETLVGVAHDITERKQNEEALRESEQRFRSAFESAGIGMALVGPDGSWLRVNQPLCDIVGYPEQELLELTFQDITHPDDLGADIGQVERTLRGEIQAYQMEKRYLHKDGHAVWILLSVSLVRDDEGEPLYFISQMQDITQSKRAEEALEESRRALATLMSNLPGMAYRCRNDEHWTMQFVSEGCVGLTGYSPGELVDNRTVSYGDLIHPDDGETVWESVQTALSERRPFQFTYRIMTASGTRKWVWEQGQGVFSPSGMLVALEGFVTDTTERKRVQELLEERVATLSGIASDLTLDRPTEAVLGALAESVVNASTAVACGIVLIGEREDAPYLFGSHGLPEGYTLGLQEAYRAGAQSPSLEAFRAHRPVLTRDIRADILADPLYSPVHRYMREVPWDISYSLPLVSRGRAMGVIFFCFLPEGEPGEDEKIFLRAVADQAAVAVENARLLFEARGKAALEERQKLARELHDSVSQALYGIALGVETARELLPDAPERAAEPLDYATTLAEAGMTEMRALIFELRPESLEKEGLVAALEKQAAAVQARHGIRVEATFGEEPAASLETKESLHRIAQEALHNTVKHSQADNAKIELAEHPGGITLEVSDDGKGFDAGGDFPGHLGLESMRERASRQGGTLSVESQPGQGVRIVARVPSR